MTVEHLSVAFEDSRGSITDVLQSLSVEHIALFQTRKGSVRGNHYHVHSTALIYVLQGAFKVRARLDDGPIEFTFVKAGDLLTLLPRERHVLVAEEDSVFLMMTHGPDGGRQYVSDTVQEAV